MRKFVVAVGVFSLISANAIAGGTLKGKVSFTGTAPKATPINMAADPQCKKLHEKPLMTDYVIVNSNATLKNVFTWVKGGLEGKTFPTPKESVTFDQRGCHYSPHVFGIMVNQPLDVLNSDPTLHNVHAMPKASQPFNLGMPVQNMKVARKFEKPEIGVTIKCDVHPWMKAFANVVDNPFYGVTGDDGSFEIKNVPAGKYTLATWHEKYGTKETTVTVEEGKTATADFTYTGAENASAAK